MTDAGARPRAVLDHIVVMAADLADGVAWFEERTGVRVPFGGRHDLVATHNAVGRLAGGTDIYAEIEF